MGLILLIIAGGVLGWLATIGLQIEDGRTILRNIIAGIIGSVVVGLAMSGVIFLGAIQASTLLYAMAGSIMLIGLYNIVRQRALP